MIIRNAAPTLNVRAFPSSPVASAGRAVLRGQLDAFEPAAGAQLAQTQSPQNGISTGNSSAGGGFFSQLFSRLKGVASGLLGQAGSWLSTNAGGLISKATSFVSDLLGKASSWLGGLLTSLQGKLQ